MLIKTCVQLLFEDNFASISDFECSIWDFFVGFRTADFGLPEGGFGWQIQRCSREYNQSKRDEGLR
ncbi:hypothetical protein BDD43_5653 [Mucilaginibacter gracilis]|uniref:Uncharacterized protein n=1 Tax=Mucilaginibacter gracilis TaxID=423350 RepID=A0A495JAF9_9SPHI|nr:hypothetical protein BDD43_5653 [Mucilaginibacter gracilis]